MDAGSGSQSQIAVPPVPLDYGLRVIDSTETMRTQLKQVGHNT